MEETSKDQNRDLQNPIPSKEIFPIETMLSNASRPRWRDYSPSQRYGQQQKKYEPLQHFGKTTILKKLLLPTILLLITLITVVFVNRQQSLHEQNLTTVPQPTPTLTNVETTVPSDWKVYTNEEHLFSLQYPSFVEMKTSNLTSNQLVDISYTDKSAKGKGAYGYWGWFIRIYKAQEKQNDLPLREWAEQEEFFGMGIGEGDEPTITDTTFAGKNAIIWKYKSDQSMNPNIQRVLIEVDKKVIFIETNIIGDKQEYQNTLDQILSTFKFMDQETTDTSIWETYTNPSLGFSLKYPQTVTLTTSESESPSGPILNSLHLYINIESLESIVKGESSEHGSNYNLGYDSDVFEKDLRYLKDGEYGESIDFAYQHPENDSRKVVKIGNKYAKTFTVLGRFESCDVTFERKAIFYPDDNSRVIITFFGPHQKIVSENPTYFELGGSGGRWKNCSDPNRGYGMESFFKDLAPGKTSSASSYWYDTFDQILSTFKFLD